MKRIEEIWNTSTKSTIKKGIAICDLLECEVCGVREQCKNAKSHEEMDAAWAALVAWANEEISKPSKHS